MNQQLANRRTEPMLRSASQTEKMDLTCSFSSGISSSSSFHSIQVFFQGIQFTIDYNKLFMLEEVHQTQRSNVSVYTSWVIITLFWNEHGAAAEVMNIVKT